MPKNAELEKMHENSREESVCFFQREPSWEKNVCVLPKNTELEKMHGNSRTYFRILTERSK